MSHILIIGLDGATWDLLTPMVKSNKLPFLASLMKSGTHGILESETPPLTPAAWTSFHTGKKPGEHGVIDFFTWNRSTNSPDLFDSGEIGTTFWDNLAQKSLKTATINVPMTYPPDNISGFVVSGILTPDFDSTWTSPPSLREELLKIYPDYKPLSLLIPKASEVHADPKKFLEQMHHALESRFQVALWLNQAKNLDVSMVQFQIIDWVQHVLWDYLSDENSQYYAAIVSEIYTYVDSCIEKLWSEWSNEYDDSQILILSDHGFQKHIKRINLGNSFYQAKFLDQHAGAKKKINSLLSKAHLKFENDSPFELVGRSGWGRVFVKPKVNIRSLYDEIEQHCQTLIDPETNKPVIKKVWFREELYSGKKIERLPEIIIEPENGYTISAAIDKSGVIYQEIDPNSDFHSGIHHKDGIILSSKKIKLPEHISNVAEMIIDQAS